MTLLNPVHERMLALGFKGMAEAYERQQALPDVDALGFEDRLALLLDAERAHRRETSYRARLRQARLPHRADIQDVDCRAGRGITRSALLHLAEGGWIRQGSNLILEGATGAGKSFLATALADVACRQQASVLYRRVPELFQELAQARASGRHIRLLRKLARVQLLLLDDFGLAALGVEDRRDLLEIVNQRHRKASTLVAGQVPPEQWHPVIGEPTIADSIVDRLLSNGYRIQLSGDSMRPTLPPLEEAVARAAEIP